MYVLFSFFWDLVVVSLGYVSGIYIVGIMFYKLGLEFFNGSITTLATDRFRAASAFTKSMAFMSELTP